MKYWTKSEFLKTKEIGNISIGKYEDQNWHFTLTLKAPHIFPAFFTFIPCVSMFFFNKLEAIGHQFCNLRINQREIVFDNHKKKKKKLQSILNWIMRESKCFSYEPHDLVSSMIIIIRAWVKGVVTCKLNSSLLLQNVLKNT